MLQKDYYTIDSQKSDSIQSRATIFAHNLQIVCKYWKTTQESIHYIFAGQEKHYTFSFTQHLHSSANLGLHKFPLPTCREWGGDDTKSREKKKSPFLSFFFSEARTQFGDEKWTAECAASCTSGSEGTLPSCVTGAKSPKPTVVSVMHDLRAGVSKLR